jgi:ribonuclease P protein component
LLARESRLRSSAEFTAVMRRGTGHGRGTSPALVVHVELRSGSAVADEVATRIGFAVPRAVGGAVVRNRVRRRLRALSAERLGRWPAGIRMVVRALPPAALLSYTALAADLDRAAATALRRAGSSPSTPRSVA